MPRLLISASGEEDQVPIRVTHDEREAAPGFFAEGDLIRGWHYGQRLYVPHKQVGHMVAPTSVAEALKNPCQWGAVHTGSN